jgi:predicted DNA-binding protein
MWSSITDEYYLKNRLSQSISEELQYFFGSDYVRITLDKEKSSIKLSDELKEKIDNFN